MREKKLRRITQVGSVIAVEAVRAIVDRKLSAKSDVEAFAGQAGRLPNTKEWATGAIAPTVETRKFRV
jgi:hypothetical protein